MTATVPTSALPVIKQAQIAVPAASAGPAMRDSSPSPTIPGAETRAVDPRNDTGFQDGATGRYVTRVSDRWSGHTLLQIPSAELLRFLATEPAAVVPSSVDDG